MRIEELKIINRFQNLFPPQTEDEYANLKESISEEGLLEPITIWKENIVIDGHNRLRACKELGYAEVKTFYKEFEDEDSAELWAIRKQSGRRNIEDRKVRLNLARRALEIIASSIPLFLCSNFSADSGESPVKSAIRCVDICLQSISPIKQETSQSNNSDNCTSTP